MFSKLKQLVILARPKHWIKNLIILTPLVFSGNLMSQTAFINSVLATLSFCLISSCIYTFNDIFDRKKDTQHPIKKNRPIASKKISIKEGIIYATLLGIISISITLLINQLVTVFIVLYFVNNVIYNLFAKKHAIIDAISISIGFLLRVYAGALAINVQPSNWILITTFFAALFLAFNKRKNEYLTLGDKKESFRKVLNEYSIDLLNQLITSTATITIISYALYTIDEKNSRKLTTPYLTFTTGLVALGIYSFLRNSNNTKNTDPVNIITSDKTIIISSIAWIISIVAINYFK